MNEDIPLYSWVIKSGLFCLFLCADPEKFSLEGGGVTKVIEFSMGGGGPRHIFGNIIM